jgi:hypothetical protein
MGENKKEEMKNWLETGIRETNDERLARTKKALESFERKENLIKHGKNMTDMEIINEANLKKILSEFISRLVEIEQLKASSKDRKFILSLEKLTQLIEQTLEEIQSEQKSLRIDTEKLLKKLDFFNLELERINNFKDTKIKETNKERDDREKRVADEAPYRQWSAPLTPRDKDY